MLLSFSTVCLWLAVSAVRFSDSVAMLTQDPDPALLVSCGSCSNINVGVGLPKAALTKALVTQLGVVGDAQREGWVEYWGGHGGRDKAVMLWSAEAILRVQADGHPAVTPGTCGELTLSGVDWSVMKSGVTLSIGRVLLEVTFLKGPCSAQQPFFASVCCGAHQIDGRNRISPCTHPGDCRVLARVLRPGWVRKGDAVRVFKAGRENKQIVQETNEKGVYLSEAKEGDNGT